MKTTKIINHQEQWDKENVLYDALLLPFTQPIKFDFTIPDPYKVVEIIKNCLKEVKLSKKLADEVAVAVYAPTHDDYEPLYFYLSNYENLFGNEFIYGYGTLYRWRDREREKANQRVNKYIPVLTKKRTELIKLQAAIKTKNELILNKTIGVH